MAVNDIENPDEGTPRNKKDVRRERRQMRAMNADRPKFTYTPEGEKVKNPPLYSKEEIREVGKPFKSQPSIPMTGTIGGLTYNDPNKPAEHTYSYQRSEVINRLGETREIGPIDLTKEQYEAISEGGEAGQALANTLKNNAINNDKLTLDEKQKRIEVGQEAGKELERTDEQINQQAKQEINTVTGGDGKTAAGVMEKAPTQYDWTLSEPAIQYTPTSIDEINAQASQAKKKAPQLVIEKLGVQDYYPEIGRDIAVGNFSGSYAGSRTIFSGAGGLLPLGLYDARKRAIAAEVKRKEAIMDQIKEIPDIAKQFKTEFSQIYMNDFLAPWVNAYKDNPDGLMSNTDFLKDMAHYKSVAENFLKVDSDLKKFKELVNPKDGNPAAYATNGMLEIAHKFLSGFLPGETKSWLTGKKNISKITETVQAIPNGYNWADKKVELLLKEGEAEIPIYPKDGVEWNSMTETDKAKIKNDVNGLVVSLQDGSPDYETYLTSLKKYFHFDFETIADEWIKGNSLNALTPKEKEEYKKSLAIYMLKQMPPDSIINKIDTVANDAAERRGQDLSYAAKLADIAAENYRFETARKDHNSVTRGQIETMMESGITESALRVNDPKIASRDPQAREYKVWMVDDKGNWRQEYVDAKEIQSANERSIANGNNGMYFEKKGGGSGNAFNVPATAFFGVDQNVVYKTANGYNGQQYETVYRETDEVDPITKEKIYAPTSVQARTKPTTIYYNGVYDTGAEASYNTTAGQNPTWQAADTKGRGPEIKTSEYKGSFNKTSIKQ